MGESSRDLKARREGRLGHGAASGHDPDERVAVQSLQRVAENLREDNGISNCAGATERVSVGNSRGLLGKRGQKIQVIVVGAGDGYDANCGTVSL
jgi:hypothetical protein